MNKESEKLFAPFALFEFLVALYHGGDMIAFQIPITLVADIPR